jgi:hypothetical protein
MLADPYHSDSSYNGDSSDDDGSSVSATATEEIVPCDADVLLGRGTKHHLHPGNMRYNGTRELRGDVRVNTDNEVLSLTRTCLFAAALLDLNRDRYNSCTNSIAKRAIIREIVSSILSNKGRFLKDNNNKAKQWVVISSAKAHLKTAHAIQYRMRKMAMQRYSTRHMTTASFDRPVDDQLTSTIRAPSAECDSFGDCAQRSNECCDKCTNCQDLESRIEWILLAQQQCSNTPLTDHHNNGRGNGTNVSNSAHLQANIGRTAAMTLMPSNPSTDAIHFDDDPVDRLLMQHRESLASFEPLDLSMFPACPDDSAAAMASLMESANIDPAWLWSSLDVHV